MVDRLPRAHVLGNGAARATFVAALLLGPLPGYGARSSTQPQAALTARVGLSADMAQLARARPNKCLDEKALGSGPPGWTGGAAQCAWQNRLRMRRWEAAPEGAPGCLSQPAQWWAWARSLGVRPTAPLAWNSGWTGQAFVDGGGALKRAGFIERAPDGTWHATEWSWDPSPRPATRDWQQGRWNLLIEAAARTRQPERAELRDQEVAPLRSAWEKQLNGRAGEVALESWRWQRDGLCLRMETGNLAQAQLRLPHAREDSRLEQRAAMQLQLARTYPKAIWLAPFRLLTMPDATPRAGAKYAAIWGEPGGVKGQLWMPRADGTVLRARVAVALALAPKTAGAAGAARAIESELTGLAGAWERDNER